jgi:hypothetical protein
MTSRISKRNVVTIGTAQEGVAMISVMLVMMLISALLVGFTVMAMGDQRYRFIDRDRNQSFYAASAGLEKLTADLGNLFFVYVAPTATQISALTTTPPTIPDVSFTKADNTSGYEIASQYLGGSTVSSGPYQGLYALITQYTMNVTARTKAGSDTHLQRVTETVAIPVFQFGIFSDVDLSFFAGPDFNFGGRVHTNGNLFLSEGGGATLTLSDKITAVKEIIRQRLQNGALISTSPSHDGTVSVTTGGGFRTLAATEGSVVDGVGSALNEPPGSGVSWTNVSLSTYNAAIRNGRTGAKTLNLAVIAMGGTNVDLSRRPVPNENLTNPSVLAERDFTKASVRILLSDNAADITGLPGVTATAPVRLDGDWNAAPPNNGTAYGPISATRPPIAVSPGIVTATTNTNTPNTTATEIRVAAIPAAFKIPATIVVGANAAVTCTGRTATTFIGCTGDATAMPIGSVVRGVVASGAGTITVTAATTAAAVANAATINVSGTAAFAPTTMWLAAAAVSCSGYTTVAPVRFTGCLGVPATTQPQTITTNALSAAGTGTIGGYIKIEKQDSAGVWTDVTMEMLNYGIGGPNLAGAICADPTPSAVIRLQRLKDNGGSCDYAPATTGANNSTDYWPNALFDTREALVRDTAPVSGNIILGGVMHYVAIDAANLAKWFAGTGAYAAGTGTSALNNGGYSVYFSDRRNNRDALSNETGEYGWEDFVNPASATGAPNGVLDGGEDVNGNLALDTYGQFPAYNGVAQSVPPGATTPLDLTARPWTELKASQAMVNRAVLFRRALKIFDGAVLAPTITGLSFVSENPVYVQGNWNANGAWTDPHAATAVMGDSVTLLSNSWNDANAFAQPYNFGARNRNTPTWYRLAIVSGKGMAFPQPAGTATDFGTDGGAHNFLHYLENGDQAVNYRGSIVTFFYNRQAVGTYKCCATVYSAPTRNYAFDSDFLDPTKLPPLTPVFRDVNTIGFSQETRPGR